MKNPTIKNSIIAYLGHEDSPDISNPIHSTEVAQAYGFKGPLVGGVTVWGWATETILQALGEKWLDSGWAEYSFRQPTFPGDKLFIQATQNNSTNNWTIEMINEFNVVCVIGEVGVGNAPWEKEFIKPTSMTPKSEIKTKPSLSLDETPKHTDWNAMQVTFDNELASEFTTVKQITTNPLFIGESKIAHPSWIAGWAEQLMRHNFDIPTSMHTKSRVQHRQSVPEGTTVIGGAHILDIYERKAHHFVNFDVLLQDHSGSDIAQLRHWTIFKIATEEERAKL
tara:strand:+ start:3364 stop:4206 length:843 start_codon:yes stop_codon:yes gene_type:complete